MKLQSLPFIIITAFCFGSSLIASRFGIGQISSVEFVALRISFASVAFALLLLARPGLRWQLDRKLLQHGLILGLLATAIPMFAFVGSLVYLSSGMTSIINATGPAFTVTLAHFFLIDESLTWRKVVGVLLSLSGAIMLASQGESGLVDVAQADPRGYILVFVGLISVSIGTIYTRRYAGGIPATTLTSVQLFAATFIVLPVVGLVYGFDLAALDGQGWFAVLYGSLIGTVAAFLLFFYTIQRFGATDVALVTYVVPVVATIGGLLVLGETITGRMIIGMIIILAGIAVINLRRRPD